MPMTPLDRRTLLRGAGGAIVALPFLDAMIPTLARGASSTPQKRFVMWYTPCCQEPQWWFEGGSTDELAFQGSSLIAPLEAHRSNLLITRNVDNQAATDARAQTGGTGHAEGMWTMLTGKTQQGGAQSLDRAIATKHFRATNAAGERQHRRNAMDAAAVTMWPDANTSPSYDPYMNNPDYDPRAVWDRFFQDYTAPDAGAPPDPRPKQRKSILSLVLGDYRTLRSKLGAADKQRLEAHLHEIESLETRIIDAPPAPFVIQPPQRPPQYASDENDFRFNQQLVEDIGKWNVDLAYYAFVCDLTPVANIIWGRSGGDAQYKSLGITDGHHGLTHPGVSHYEDCDGKRRRIIGWYSQQLADFATRLKAAPDGANGSVFDNTLMYWSSELAEGDGHGQSGYSYVLLGGASGRLRTGRCVDLARRPHNDVLSTIAQVFDVPMSGGRFGDYGSGPIASLLT